MSDYTEVQFTRWQAAAFTPACPYVVGDTYATRPTPRFEYKPSATGYTGGGYPRLRTSERGPESGHGSNDVFVSVHRLAALVWCYDGTEHVGVDADDLRERDVHHQLEMPSANLAEHIEVLDHSEHSSRTSADRTRKRAWFEDAKREHKKRERGDYVPDERACSDCGEEVKASVAGADYCLDCATTVAKGQDVTIELL